MLNGSHRACGVVIVWTPPPKFCAESAQNLVETIPFQKVMKVGTSNKLVWGNFLFYVFACGWKQLAMSIICIHLDIYRYFQGCREMSTDVQIELVIRAIVLEKIFLLEIPKLFRNLSCAHYLRLEDWSSINTAVFTAIS